MTTRAQTAQLKKAFLDQFAIYGNISTAAQRAGCERRTIYKWQEHDDEFASAFREAELQATEALEAEARTRALLGSDTLLIFLLKARAPEKYRDRYDVTSGGQPIQAAHASLDTLIVERLAAMAARGEGTGRLALAGSREPTDT
jgi:hypothetical protein